MDILIMNNLFFNRTLLFVVFCFFSFCTKGQNNQKVLKEPNLNNGYFALSVKPSYYQPLKIKQTVGEQYVKSYPVLGGEGQLQFYYQTKNNIMFKMGLGMQVMPHGIKYSTTDSMSNYFAELLKQAIMLENKTLGNYKNGLYSNSHKTNEYFQIGYLIEFSALYKFYTIGDRYNLFAEVGTKWTYAENTSSRSGKSIVFFSSIPTVPQVRAQVFEYYLFNTDRTDDGFRWLPSITFALGISKTHKRHLFMAKIFANYVPQLIANGTFEFFQLSKPNSGTIKQRFNNVGIALVYGLGKRKKNAAIN